MMEENVFNTASHIHTPLALAGFIAAAFLAITRIMVGRTGSPENSERPPSELHKFIVEKFFYLALIAMILGFFGFALPYLFKPPVAIASEPQANSGIASVVQTDTGSGSTSDVPSKAGGFMGPGWQKARDNIKWVFDDPGAKRSYDRFRGQGIDKYTAVLQAQHGGSGEAATTIRIYGRPRTEKYISYLGY